MELSVEEFQEFLKQKDIWHQILLKFNRSIAECNSLSKGDVKSAEMFPTKWTFSKILSVDFGKMSFPHAVGNNMSLLHLIVYVAYHSNRRKARIEYNGNTWLKILLVFKKSVELL